MLYFWKAQGSRTSKLIFPTVNYTNTNTKIHKYKYTNTALLKCQDYQTYAIFLNSCWFKDVKNDIPKCPTVKYTNSQIQIQIHKYKYEKYQEKVSQRPGMWWLQLFQVRWNSKKVKETPHLHTWWSFSIPKKMSPYNTSDQDIMCSRDPVYKRLEQLLSNWWKSCLQIANSGL